MIKRSSIISITLYANIYKKGEITVADNHSERDLLLDKIKNQDEYAIGALLKIYSFQTNQEQEAKGTYKDNYMGFNSADAGFMSSMAEQFLRKGSLTERQIPYVKKCMPKYIEQLMAIGFGPINFDTLSQITPAELPTIQTAKLQNNNITIKFQYPKGDPRFFETVEKVKALPGRRFDGKEKTWKCPLSIEAIEKLTEWKFDISSDLLEWYKKITSTPELNSSLEIPGLQKELFPFQKEGVSFIESRGGKVLIGDEMGLGKTAQALAWLQLHPELRPVVIIVPASLKLNWLKEISIWMQSEQTHIISGQKAYPLPHKSIFIINYDILPAWVEEFKKADISTIILDESHYIKNSTAKRSKAVIKLCKNIKHVIALSGTPIINRPIEFYNTIKIIEPGLFPSRWKFAHEFCGARHNGFGWDFNGATKTTELHNLLTSTIMIRRKKEDVLKDLPPKIRSVVPLEIENYEEYKFAESDIISWIRENEGKEKAEKAKQAEVLVAFEKLKQLAINGKIKQCIKWIENFLESDQKLVVFATHKKTINLLMDHFNKIAVKLDGSTPADQRQIVVEQFQNDEKIRLFVGNIKAAGIGITLTAASNVCFLELPWTPGEAEQAEDRCHRIGQKASSINIYYLIANGTIEEDIAEIISKKQKVLTAILDGEEVDQDSVLSALLKKINKK